MQPFSNSSSSPFDIVIVLAPLRKHRPHQQYTEGLTLSTGEGTPAAVTTGTTSVTGTYGTLTIAADGTWSYLLDNDDAETQALAAGERVTDVFTYTMVDGEGVSSSTTLTVHIEGSNDGPVIDGGPATASMNEGASGTTPAALSGSFTFADPDASDRPGSGTADTVGTASLAASLAVTGSLNAEQLAAAQALSSFFTVALAGGATNEGTINWTFAPTEAALNFLGAAQTATLTFTVALYDGNGGSDTETVTITLTGTNDAVALVPGGTLSGTVTEQTEAQEAAPEAPETLTATGTFQFTDPDLAANPVQRLNYLGVVNGPSQWGGTLTQTNSITDAATGTKTLVWTYSIAADNANLQALGVGETLTETFTIRVLDQAAGGLLTQTITITLTGSNDRPVIAAVDVADTIAEDAGTSLVTTGSLTFTDADVSVGVSTADTSTVTEALHAVAWTGGTLSGTALTDLETALATAFSIAGDGVATAANTGTVTWAFDLPQTAVDFLAAGETLTVTYRVTVTDDSGDTATNTATQDVTITITGTNDAPTLAAETIAVTDTAAADSFVDITGMLDGADLDTTNTLAYGLATGEDGVGDYGTLTVNPDGSYTYVVNAAAVNALSADATDTFTVQVTDSSGATTTQTLTVNVTGANDTPEAQNGTATATEDAGAITIDVADLISDRDSADTDATLTVIPSVDPSQGSVSVSGTVITFTPAANFFGTATISYTVSDVGGLESDPATITVDVAPEADTDSVVQSGTLDVDSQGEVQALDEFGDPIFDGNGDPVMVPNGLLTIGTGNTASGFVIATDAADAAGVELGLSTVMRFAGPAARDASGAFVVQAGEAGDSVANNDAGTTDDDGWARWNIVFSINADTDNNGGTLADLDYRVTISEQTETGFVSRLSFTLQEYAAALDMLYGTGTGAFFLAQSLRQDMINLEWAHIKDAWGDQIADTADDFNPSNPGLYQVDLVASTFAGVGGAPASELLRATMQVRVNSPATANDDVNGADVVVEAGELDGTPVGDATASGNVLTNDEDPDLYPVADETELVVVDVTFGATTVAAGTAIAGAYGSLTLNADGTWTYTLDDELADSLAEGDSETEVFTYTVTDPDGETDTATLTITITGSNDAPVVTSDAAAAEGAVTEDGTISATGTLTSSDIDAGATAAWTVAGTGAYGGITITEGGVWTYTLDARAQALAGGQVVTETFIATVTDDKGATATQTITITVTGTNDLPVIDGTSVVEGTVEEAGERTTGTVAGTATASGQLTATDADAGQTAGLTWAVEGPATSTYGSFAVTTAGEWTYTLGGAADALAEGDVITETFTVRVSDGVGGTADQVVTIRINGTNDAPVITSSTTDAEGSVTEAATGNTAPVTATTVTGQLTATDVDTGDTPEWTVASGNGTYGTLSITTAGLWTYTLDDSRAATQALVEGQVVTDTFTATVTDDEGVTRTQTITITVNGKDEVLTGTTGDDTLTGTGNSDSLIGLGGDDSLSAGSGDDEVYGGDGDDNINAGSGDDLIEGGQGSDNITGGSGNDTVGFSGDWADYTITETTPGTFVFLNRTTVDFQ